MLSGVLPVVACAATGIPGVPEIEAVADTDGLLKATVRIVSPALDTDGDILHSISRIELTRDGETIRIFSNVEPGCEYTYTDTSLSNGYKVYRVKAYSSAGESESASTAPVFVGVDEPLGPATFKASAAADKISFTWSKSPKTGANGERVRQDGVTYLLEELDDSYSPRRTLCETKGQSFDFYMPVDYGAQDIVRFGIRAYNTTGYSDYRYLRVIKGAPYYLPYRESFSGGTASGLSWQEGDGTFAMTTSDCIDSDSGSLLCVPAADGTASSFNMGKVHMANSSNPLANFSLKGLGEGESLEFVVARMDGAEAKLLTVKGPVEEWERYSVDLSKLKKERYIIPKFRLAQGNTGIVSIDDIKFEDPFTHDLGIFIEAPERGGGETPVRLIITNEGLETADSAWVDLYVDGRHSGKVRIEEALKAGETVCLEAAVNIQGGESVEVGATVRWLLDINPLNDKACAQVVYDPETAGAFGSSSVREIGNDNKGLEIYQIDGRRIQTTDATSLPAGLYIVNGRKTVIK